MGPRARQRLCTCDTTLSSDTMEKAMSKIAKGKMARAVVFRGTKEKTATGMTKGDLIKNSRGKIVSKKQSALAKKRYASSVKGWIVAVQKARKALGVKGFVAI